ncbi:transposase [Wenyingzhuangia sp. chi5]|uniref:Transposase n=1 Tax=Wenyingzhuangia gilva TaxID=3057677 RepID=A0ABT8VNS8_9FLAO|nr:transposase [Wenyingzhuangia sp. chi5]MDO3693623.1 transposase [Wenyingzhuangia sp. chi5]
MENNWDELTVFFDFPIEKSTIIYTTNLIENLNGNNKEIHQKNSSLQHMKLLWDLYF